MDDFKAVLINENKELELEFLNLLERVKGINIVSKMESLNSQSINRIAKIGPDMIITNLQEVDKIDVADFITSFSNNKGFVPRVLDIHEFFEWINSFETSSKPKKVGHRTQNKQHDLGTIKKNEIETLEKEESTKSKAMSSSVGSIDNKSFMTKRLPVRMANKLRLLKFENIKYILASNYYAEVHTEDKRTHLVRESMSNLDDFLGVGFLRIHRSYIINLDHIEEIVFSNYSEIDVKMSDGKLLRVGKKYKRGFTGIMNL